LNSSGKTNVLACEGYDLKNHSMKGVYLSSVALFISFLSFSQVGIGTTNPSNMAVPAETNWRAGPATTP
jgi:hypothetical protein